MILYSCNNLNNYLIFNNDLDISPLISFLYINLINICNSFTSKILNEFTLDNLYIFNGYIFYFLLTNNFYFINYININDYFNNIPFLTIKNIFKYNENDIPNSCIISNKNNINTYICNQQHNDYNIYYCYNNECISIEAYIGVNYNITTVIIISPIMLLITVMVSICVYKKYSTIKNLYYNMYRLLKVNNDVISIEYVCKNIFTKKIKNITMQNYVINKEVCILFLDIVNFSEKSLTISNHELFDIISNIFLFIDKLTKKHSILKIETAGDSYIAISSYTTDQPNFAINMAKFAFDIIKNISNITYTKNIDGIECNYKLTDLL